MCSRKNNPDATASTHDGDRHDTIAAIATAQGRSGIGVVRISGPNSHTIATHICQRDIEIRRATLCGFHDANGLVLDRGLVVRFAAPHSFTGEEVIEFHCHGSPVVLGELVNICIALGARRANPGEFTERAFLNGQLDLAQAESVIDLIDARSAAAARAAVRSLEGEFSRLAHLLVEQLIEVRVYVEGALDFSEEDVDFLSNAELTSKIALLTETLSNTRQAADSGRLLRDGVAIAIAGAPNVGKSTLLNALIGYDAAITTDIPGTTRDVLREYHHFDGLPVTLFDTAGLRESTDPIEQEGISRASQTIRQADVVLSLRTTEIAEVELSLTPHTRVIEVVNKIDLAGEAARVKAIEDRSTVYISASNKDGLTMLVEQIKKMCGYRGEQESTFIARQRHVDALLEADAHIKKGLDVLAQRDYPELAAEDFKLAQQSLGRITGEFHSDDLLGEIFSRFCIGK
ncbi:MAG: tRNA uridine-5-carboxymethylaminomethyl(34) synthesis GTPase MnmE [Pseudomonadota bacterium]